MSPKLTAGNVVETLKKRKSFSLRVAAFAAVLSLITLFGAPAFADEPGEWSTWSPEMSAGHQVSSHIGVSQARDPNGNVADVWTDSNNRIVVSYNNGVTYVWPNAVTYYRPRIIWTTDGPRVFHTGTDQHVYYAGFQVNGDQSLTLGNWEQVPDNVLASGPPTVTALPGDSQEQWMLAWWGLDGNVYAQWHQRFNNATDQGYFAQPAFQGSSTSPPSLAWAGNPDEILLTYNSNNTVVLIAQTYGFGAWNWIGSRPQPSMNPVPLGSIPAISVTSSSRFVMISERVNGANEGSSSSIVNLEFDPNDLGTFVRGTWQNESTGVQANGDVTLSPGVDNMYILYVSPDGSWWWKQDAQ